MFGHFSERGGGDCLIPKFLRKFFLNFGNLSGRGVGGYLIPKLLRNFSACVWTFFKRKGGGGLPDSKDDEEHFSFYLDIFQVKFGGITKVQTL